MKRKLMTIALSALVSCTAMANTTPATDTATVAQQQNNVYAALAKFNPELDEAKLATIKQELASKSRKGVWIDVRTPEEFNDGHIEKATNIPYDEIEKVQKLIPNKNEVINLYCKSGRRASIAKEALVKAGYTNVVNFGGYNDLKTLF